jgi:hypothetical protein
LLKKLDEILSQLEDSTDKALNLAESFGLKKSTLDNIENFLTTLKKDRLGNYSRSLDNLRAIDKFRSKLTEYIGKDTSKINADFAKSIESNGKFINLYFSEMINGYQASKQIYNDIRALSIYETNSLLIGSGMESSLSEPIISLMKENVKSGTNFINLRKLLLNQLEGTPETDALVKRYVKQIVNDSVMGYNRAYLTAISQDLGLNHYLYRGTKIADTRAYCASRAGKVFTEDQVRQSASLEWSGKRKGTNSINIFNFAGGYNCRHEYIPISVEIYNTLNGWYIYKNLQK